VGLRTLRLSLSAKLLLAFAVVLLPIFALMLVTLRSVLVSLQQGTLDDHLLTAQAVAVQVDASFDAAIGVGWAVANDPLSQTMDPSLLDPHLQALVASNPGYDTVNVFDAQGVNRGWGNLTDPAGPRLFVGDRDFFLEVMATNTPVISQVLELRRPTVVGVVASVPIRGPDGRPIGVVNVVTRTDQMAKRYEAAKLEPGQAILLADRTGRLAFDTLRPDLTYDESNAFSGFEPIESALAGVPSEVAQFTSPIGGDSRMGAFVPTPKYHWAVGVTIPRDVALAPLQETMRRQLLAFGGIVVLSLGLAFMLARFLFAPVRQLESAARDLGRGDLTRRVRISTGDELQRLGGSFNEMAGQLEQRQAELRESMRVREEFMSAAAHELKTPITTIKGWTQVLLKSNGRRPVEQKALETIDRQTERITHLIEELLSVVRLRAGASELHRERFDLSSLVRSLVEGGGEMTEQHGLRVEPDGPLWVDADRPLIAEVLGHLLQNAVRYSPKGGTVELEARRDGREAVVSVRDHGEGIPLERQAHVFEPFYEPVPPGLPSYVGIVSLGLHLSRQVVEAHGGRIWFTSTPGEGSTFFFSLPLEGE
jgi:signal transduction histidine kinase